MSFDQGLDAGLEGAKFGAELVDPFLGQPDGGLYHRVAVFGGAASAGALTTSGTISSLGGAITLIGVLSGANHEFRLPLVVTRKIRLEGVTCGSYAQFDAMLRAIEASGLRPALDDTRFGLDDFPAALAHMREGRHFGKIVIEI